MAARSGILIGSSETMGTGVNAQRRLKALHHLDVPWLPSQIEQREGRIERQGNENDEIELYAYATKRSVDATGWQILERKARFIDAAMSGDRSVRRIEDAGSQANQFALAKAIASGDERLMRKAGIASEIARLERLRDSHFDDQFAIRRKIGFGEKRLEDASRRIEAIAQDLARRIPTRGDAFLMMVGEQQFTERKAAGEALIAFVRKMKPQKPGATAPIAAIGGFTIVARTSYFDDIELRLDRALKSSDAIAYEKDVTPLGLVSRSNRRSGASRWSLRRSAARSLKSPAGCRASRPASATPFRMRWSSKRSAPKWPNSTLRSPRPPTTRPPRRATPPRNPEERAISPSPSRKPLIMRRTTPCCPQQLSARSHRSHARLLWHRIAFQVKAGVREMALRKPERKAGSTTSTGRPAAAKGGSVPPLR